MGEEREHKQANATKNVGLETQPVPSNPDVQRSQSHDGCHCKIVLD